MRRVRCCRSRGRAILIDCNRRGRLWIHMHNSTAVSSKCEQCHVHSHVGITSPWSGGQGAEPPEAESILVIRCPTEPANLAPVRENSMLCYCPLVSKLGGQSAWCPQPRHYRACAPLRLRRLCSLLLRSWSDADNERVLCGLVGLHVSPSVCPRATYTFKLRSIFVHAIPTV